METPMDIDDDDDEQQPQQQESTMEESLSLLHYLLELNKIKMMDFLRLLYYVVIEKGVVCFFGWDIQEWIMVSLQNEYEEILMKSGVEDITSACLTKPMGVPMLIHGKYEQKPDELMCKHLDLIYFPAFLKTKKPCSNFWHFMLNYYKSYRNIKCDEFANARIELF